MRGIIQLCAAMSATLFGVAYAHHSASATYDSNSQISIEGTLVTIQLMNPHSFMIVQVAGEGGSVSRWTAEWLSYRGLEAAGVTRATLKPGDRLVLTGLPARKREEQRILLRRIERSADGWQWSGSGDEG
jgi:hypothetical protein